MTDASTTISHFVVRRDDFRQTRITQTPLGEGQPGQVLFRIDRYALTSNNITYAAIGEQFGYWTFFPAEEDWGRIPCFAFADVEKSHHPDVKAGDRYFGYFPMSTHLWMKPELTTGGFIDSTEHRAALPPFYNRYTRVADDPMYQEKYEDAQMLLQPMFMTAFLIDDFLFDNAFFGAESVIVTSASSKTSLSLSHRLRERKVKTIGLTSAGNRAFVENIGWYDAVSTYDAVASLDKNVPTMIVDMAGNGELKRQLHEHFGDYLKYDCVVGRTHWEGPSAQDLPGVEPQIFFAPQQIKKRTEELGMPAFMKMQGQAWVPFVQTTDQWLKVVRHYGGDAVQETYDTLVNGRCSPQEGQILSLWERSEG